ncbi:MAG: VWA domain-containing protein [Acidobacteriota bacterium]
MKKGLAPSLLSILIALNLPICSFPFQQQPPSDDRSQKSTKPADAQKPDDKVRLQANLVSLIVTVTDPYGRFVTGLDKEHFEIYDNNVKQDIAMFSDEDAPITLGIIYDVSGSMGNLTTRSFEVLKKFFYTSHDDDEYFVVAFNNKPQLVQDFTMMPEEILSRTIFVKAKGSTALYDAVYLAAEKAKQGRHPKKALLLLSDGLENNSRYSLKELKNMLKEADVQIYCVGFSSMIEGSYTLKYLAELTGGRAFFPADDNEVGDLYTRMAIMLRRQYAIGFYPSDTSSGNKWHDVKIKINAPKGLGRISLYYKKGYQAFAP